MLYADIIVDAPTDPTKHYFTYQTAQNLKSKIIAGQIVSVPWGKTTKIGLVLNTKKETDIENPKEIISLASIFPILLPYQLKLLSWLSWYYHAPMLDCLKAMVPQGMLNAKRLKTNELSAKSFSRLPLDVRQTIVLAPTINQIPTILASITPKPKSVAIYHYELGQKKLFNTWNNIYSGSHDLVIGSRSAIFAPCLNLSQITIYDEENNAYKDERSPYYHSVDVAAKLSQITNTKVTLKSFSPQVSSFYKYSESKNSISNQKFSHNIRLERQKLKNIPKIDLIDMVRERKLQNFTNLSDGLRYNLIEFANSKKKVLLFLNRKTEAGNLYCLACRFTNYIAYEPETCPNCNSANVKFFSLNIKRLAQEIKDMIPEAKISILSEEDQKSDYSSDLTIATSSVVNSLYPHKFSLIGVISADTILALPDYLAAEKTFHMLTQIINLAGTCKAKMIIQTFNPNHYAIIGAISNNYRYFYQKEIGFRKSLGYPPFSSLVKIIISSKKPEAGRDNADKLADKLKQVVNNKNLKVEILGPSLAAYPQLSTKTNWIIILKGENRDILGLLLEIVPAKYQMIIDPKDTL